jgi:LPXTG-site transpeptidase (sortase) family protein
MKNLWSKFKIIFLLLFFLLIISLLIFGLYTLITTKSQKTSAITGTVFTDSSLIVTKVQGNNTIDYDKLPNGLKDNIIDNFITTSLLKIPSISSSNIDRIIISTLNINAPIIQGEDGDAALDIGFWLYPASSSFDGEKIVFCHRRYWGKTHPHSCWYLDKVAKGDIIQIVDKDGSIKNYKIISSNQLINSDPGIISVSNQDLVKIITCAPLGYSTHRLVVIGQRI